MTFWDPSFVQEALLGGGNEGWIGWKSMIPIGCACWPLA